MSTVNALSGLTAAANGTTATSKKKSLGQDEFLKLMTTQMTHQDPTKPMDNAQFLSQMAQFGTVSGIQDLQQSFKDFSASISSDQALQAAGLVGRSVSVSSDQGVLTAGGDVKGTVDLPASSSNVNLKILDSVTGDVIKTQSLGEHSAGSMAFSWNGTNDSGNFASPGVYKVQLETNVDGVNTILKPDIQSRVESVSMGSGNKGVQVNLSGLGAVNFNQIKQIL
jgi:flagellar basal-body rod modification protein FlgD